MRTPTIAMTESIDFDSLGHTLELLDGQTCTLALAFQRRPRSSARRHRRPAPAATPLGGVREGLLHVCTQQEVDRDLAELPDAPRAKAGRGERAHLFEVGDLTLAIGSAEFVGASYHDRVLTLQVGPVLMNLDFSEEAADA